MNNQMRIITVINGKENDVSEIVRIGNEDDGRRQ